MDKRTQLNINIDEVLLKELKKLASSYNLPLSVFIRNSLRKIVSGKREEIYSIANYYFVNVLEDSTAQGGFLHSEYFILVDKEGRIRARNDDNGNNIGVYDGTDDYQVGLLIDDIKVLMAEYNLAKKNKNESKR